MLPSPGDDPDATYFHAATKCCAFQPGLPNFLAGLVLSDDDPLAAEGRAALARRVERRVAVTPSQAGAGGVFGLLYKDVPNAFGRAPALRCSYLTASGGCGVWRHRASVCATWFCKHVRGDTGARFWKLTDMLLREVEKELALFCLAELNAGSSEVGERLPAPGAHVSELEGEIDWHRYHTLWGAWAGREVDFYRACGRIVAPLSWSQVEQISGPRVRILAELVRDAYVHLTSTTIPERLRVSAIELTAIQGPSYRITAYSEYDPLMMPVALAGVLHYFDGRPTEEALEAILTERGIRVDVGLIRRMVDFGVLGAYEPHKRSLPIVS